MSRLRGKSERKIDEESFHRLPTVAPRKFLVFWLSTVISVVRNAAKNNSVANANCMFENRLGFGLDSHFGFAGPNLEGRRGSFLQPALALSVSLTVERKGP